MPVPASAFRFEADMDPAEILDFKILTKKPGEELLEAAEVISSYTLTLYPEATALGLSIKNTGLYVPQDNGVDITIWFEINTAFYTNAAFDGIGAALPMELTIFTNNTPSRKRQRTLLLGVLQL